VEEVSTGDKMSKVMIIDVDECVGCYCCQIACKDEHVSNDWSPYAKPQPDTGQFWIKIKEMERGTTPKVKVTYVPSICMHCDNAPCIPACPEAAITKRDDGIVLIDPSKCNGCKTLARPFCIDACPYDAIYFNKELNIAQKCTMCTHLLDKGWKEPRCVSVCQRGASTFGDENDPGIRKLLEKADVLHNEYGTKPRVFYLNLPKPFVAGTVVDPSIRECIEGAKATATDLITGKKYEVATDEFGDFWFKNLEWKHRYLVDVQKNGYCAKKLGVAHTQGDINLGTIYLSKMT
jgi:tetrathionate reductase subunit B